MSNYKQVTIEDVLESGAKYGEENVLEWAPDKYRDNRERKKDKKAYDCTWVPFEFKYANGEKAQLSLKFDKVVASSGAKLPKSEDKIKNMFIVFRKITEEEISGGDFAPKQKETEEDQEKENKKAAKNVAELVKSTNQFIDALDIINKSYLNICDALKKAKTLPYSIRKNKQLKSNNEVVVFSICQSHREDPDDPDAKIELEFPLYRIKLMLDEQTKNIGVQSWDSKAKCMKFTPNVYDVRKLSSKNNYTPVLAAVKENGKPKALNIDNAASFITYNSVHTGIIHFKEIVISKFGISFNNYFNILHVKRNKSITQESEYSVEDMKKLAGSESDEDDDDVEIVTETTHKFEKMDIANMAGSDLEDEVDQPERKAKSKTKTKKVISKEIASEEGSDLDEEVEEEVEDDEADGNESESSLED